ncbi:SprT family protein [Streptococcus dentiloxodontae]
MNLTEYVKQVSLEDFGWEFKHNADWNKRLRTTGGRFFPKDGHLDFNPKVYDEHGIAVFRKVVRHELCHYHLYYQKRGYQHKDKDFKELLLAVDGLRYAPKLKNSQKPIHIYRCCFCGQIYQRKRQIAVKHYCCGQCGGKLIKMKSQNQP